MKLLAEDLERALRRTAIDKIIMSPYHATKDIYPCLRQLFDAPKSKPAGEKWAKVFPQENLHERNVARSFKNHKTNN